MNFKRAARLKAQQGVAMVVAMLALLLLAAIGTGLMFMADTENSINSNYRDSQKGYFAARAGVENVRGLLVPGSPLNNTALGLKMPGDLLGNGVIYILNPRNGETIDPSGSAGNTVGANKFLDDEFCKEQFNNLVATITAVAVGPCSGTGHVISTSLFTTQTLSTSDAGLQSGNNGADALSFKWVRITNKQNYMSQTGLNVDGTTPTSLNKGWLVCWDGFKETAVPGSTCPTSPLLMEPVWELTALAVTPPIGQNPGSRRMMQMEVANTPPVNAPAPLAAEAPIKITGGFTSNGYDACYCTPAGAIASYAVKPPASCNASTTAVYSAQSITDAGSGSLNTTAADGQTGTNALSQNQPWPFPVNQMISAYAGNPGTINASTMAPYNLNCDPTAKVPCGVLTGGGNGKGATPITFGTYPTDGYPVGKNSMPTTSVPQITYIPDSVELKADMSGSGILVINGDLAVDGGFSFYGLVLVKGHITFQGGGSQNINVFGAILAGQDINDSTDKVGGSFSFQYDTCALNSLFTKSPPRLLASHELMF